MKEESLRRLFKSAVLNAHAYQVPDSTGLVKLDAMENPYTWPENLKQEWMQCLHDSDLNRYPDAAAREMQANLRQLFAVPDDVGMMFGNGSDELIQILLMALSPAANGVLSPEPAFVMYRHLSELLDLDFIGVPLQQDFSLDMPAMLEAINRHQPGVIFLAWPNNPTGNCFAESDVVKIIQASDGIVVVDEAYHAFAGKTMLHALGQHPNLLVMRTLSKLGLAGLRLGSLFGSHSIISQLEKIRLPYNIGTLNQTSVSFISRHIDVLNSQAATILQEREKLYQAMSNLPDVDIWPTEANFFLFRVNGKTADDIHSSLREYGVLIKNLGAAHPLLKNCLRVTVGTAEENQLFITSLKKIVNAV